jgi:CO/xanthine dehydrogenase Mo-binding subunit
VGEDDRIAAWDYEAWTLSKGGRPNATTPGNIVTGALVGFATPAVVPNTTPTNPAAFSNNSNAAPAYGAGCVGTACGSTGNVRNERVLVHTIQSPFFTGPLRSPNRLQNTFANESFLDELAAAVRADPVQYRLRHLSDPRMIDVVNAAAKAANWETRVSPRPGNEKTGVVAGRGIACVLYEGDNGYSAVVADVEVDQATGVIVVKRFVQSQDSGPVSNPDGLRNQMEGGTMQGMSRALFEEVVWDDKHVTSDDWRKYPVYRFGDFLPRIDNVLINRTDVPQLGAGECTITVAAAAIGNAVFDATGARLRRVPFTPARVLEALRARG